MFTTDISLGAFISGMIVPREGGLAIALTEKLEDMVTIVFLPLVSCLAPSGEIYVDFFRVLVLHIVRAIH